jgi:hypothetical protein
VDPEALADPSSPEYIAMVFIANNDSAMLDATDTSPANTLRINQRFACLTFFLASEDDQWVNQDNWLNEDECTWFGVTCGDEPKRFLDWWDYSLSKNDNVI